MKILHFSTYEKIGGAAITANRIHRGLLKTGIESILRVAHKLSGDASVISSKHFHEEIVTLYQEYFDKLPTFRYRLSDASYYFSTAWFPGIKINKVFMFNPDIVHLHWISSGFIRIESLSKIHGPIVWTLHDSWPFTGGCHIPFECKKYKQNCGKCPALGSSRSHDLSSKVLYRKKKSWKDLDITLVAPSKWIAECARESSLFRNKRIEIIPNGIDTSNFKPIDKNIAKQLLNIPSHKKIILFGAVCALSDKNKGYVYLKNALENLTNIYSSQDIELMVFGVSKPAIPPEINFKTHFMGHLYDDISLAVIYSAADVMVVPSILESFGLTTAESMACGTPVAAFDTSGLKDIIDNNINGYLAKPFDVEDLAKGIKWIIEDKDRWNNISHEARKKVKEKFSLNEIVEKYCNLYRNILNHRI